MVARSGVALTLLAASAAAASPARTPTPRARRAAAVLRRSPLPAAVALRPWAARVIASEEKRYTGEPISLDLKDADIRDVLLTFAKLARMNMVIDPEVKGTVTVRLDNVPWEQALEAILRSNGLGYVLEGNVARVAQPGKLQPVF